MDTELFEADETKQRQEAIENIIERLRPTVKACSWCPERMKGYHLLKIQIDDGQPISLRFTEEALAATDDPGNLPRLEQEIERQLRVSESGVDIGYVWEPR